MGLLREEWEEYTRELAPADVYPVRQLREEAFYAGAGSVLVIIGALGDDEGVTKDQGAEVLWRVAEEIREFFRAKAKEERRG